MTMTEEEFINAAKLDWEDNNIETLQDALEACYMNGSYDDVGGDAEAPTGHYYLCERWIVTTNSQGFHKVFPFDTTEEAEAAFEKLEKEFSEWNQPD